MAAFGLAAASGPAYAADGVPGGAEQPLDPADLAAEVLAEAFVGQPAAETVADATGALPATPSGVAAEEPATTGAAAAPPPEPVGAAAPEPTLETAFEAAPVAAVEEPVELLEPALDPAPEPDAPPVQLLPTNINVSVRIESPGDDGTVTQANVAAAETPAQYQPAPVRYQPVVPAGDAPEEEQAADAVPALDAQAGQNEAWEWEWAWDCASASPLELALPSGAEARTWIWNWTWNCAENEAAPEGDSEKSGDGYHAPVVQYRPVNINVAIRIASPGNNGPVLQTNVAVSLPVPVPTLAAPEVPVGAPEVPVGAPELPVGAPELPEAFSPAVAVEMVVFDAGLLDAPPPVAIEGGDAGEACCSAPARRGDLWAAEPPVSPLLRETGREERRDITVDLELDTADVARLELRSRSTEPAAAEPPRPQARPAPPARERRQRRDVGSGNLVAQGTGFAPVGGPDRLSTYAIVALFAFAFSYAFASAVAVAGRPTRGADPDDPPERPG